MMCTWAPEQQAPWLCTWASTRTGRRGNQSLKRAPPLSERNLSTRMLDVDFWKIHLQSCSPAMKWRRQGQPQKMATKTTRKVVILAITSSSFPEVCSPLLVVCFRWDAHTLGGGRPPPEEEHAKNKKASLPRHHHHSKLDLRAKRGHSTWKST